MDTEVIGIDQETDEFNIPRGFGVDDMDENLIGFISSSDTDDSNDENNETDYLSQIENNEKVQEWWKKRKNQKNKNNKRKLSDSDNETANTDKNAKYSELMQMEQSTSGLNVDNIRESQLFREFRVIGLVCNDIPFCYQKLGDSFFIGTSIGKSFQVYEGKTLRLKISGRTTQHKINAILMSHELTFTAVKSNVEIWFRVKKVGVISKHFGKVYIIKLMGHLLITIGEDKMLYVWDLKRLLNRKFDISLILNKAHNVMIEEPIKSINFAAEQNAFVDENDKIECIAHPQTYLNKIIIGYSSGKMQIWNINTCQHIYTFKHHSSFDKKTNKNVGITVIEPSPILDVVGVGFVNGMIVIHNIKTDKSVMMFEHFNHKALIEQKSNNFSINDGINGRINALSFRKDGIPFLVSVGSDTNIVVWNLKQRKLENIYYKAHNDRIISAKFIENENVLVTSSADNSLKMWVFDDDSDYGDCSGQLRLLKMRSGHGSHPYLCKFHGRKSLLSTSNDNTLRVSWIQRDIQCVSFGQKAMKKLSNKRNSKSNMKYKVPRIKSMDSSMNKSKFWSNVVTVHNNDNCVRLWSTKQFKLNDKLLRPSTDYSNVSCAIISQCGHFVYVGRVSGVIDKYNIQSCLHRGQFMAHKKGIRALHLSIFNNVLISVGIGDGLIKFWNVNNTEMKCGHTITAIAHEIISHSCFDKRSSLLAVGTDSSMIYLFDASNGNLIRKFTLFQQKNRNILSNITCLIFSPQCKWLLVSTMDGSVRVYDLMSGLCIDWFKFKNAVTHMSFAVNNTFLATTHCNTMGIHIWANKFHFSQSFLKNVGNKPIEMYTNESENETEKNERKMMEFLRTANDLYSSDSDSDSESSDSSEALSEVIVRQDSIESLPDIDSLHLSPNNSLITLSSNPKSVWKNLSVWDLILQRNRPSMKVKKNIENIPFFIPTKWTQNRYIEMDTSKAVQESINEKKTEKTKTFEKFEYDTCSKLVYFIKKEFDMRSNNESEIKYENALNYLLSLSPSSADAELHSIAITIGTSKMELILVFKFFIYQLKTNRNFEHIQSFLSLFLKIHSDLIIKHSKALQFFIRKLKELCEEKWNKINHLFQSNLCLVQFYSHIQQ